MLKGYGSTSSFWSENLAYKNITLISWEIGNDLLLECEGNSVRQLALLLLVPRQISVVVTTASPHSDANNNLLVRLSWMESSRHLDQRK